jgi:uncharacterized protein (DUF1919 family)
MELQLKQYLTEDEYVYYLKHLAVYAEEFIYVVDTGRLTMVRFGDALYIPVSQLADILIFVRRVNENNIGVVAG